MLTNARALKEAVNFYGDKQPKVMRFDATRPAGELGQGKIGKATKALESLWITTVNHKDKTGGQIEMTWLPFLFLGGFTQANNNPLVIFSNPSSNSRNLYRYLL